jgi:hypothetical protein
MYRKALETAKLGTMERTLLYWGLQEKGDILSGETVYWGMQRYVKEGSRNGQLFPLRHVGNLEEVSFTKDLRDSNIWAHLLGPTGC